MNERDLELMIDGFIERRILPMIEKRRQIASVIQEAIVNQDDLMKRITELKEQS